MSGSGLFGIGNSDNLVVGSSPYIQADNNPCGQLTINGRGDQRMTQALPERSELVRLGRSWGAAIPSANAFTFVNALPTTRAEFALYNGESVGGACYLIDRVYMFGISSMAAAQPATILAQIAPVDAAIAAPADNTAIIKHHLQGKKTTYNGSGRLALGGTTFGAIANRWSILGGKEAAMTTNLGLGMSFDVYGRYIIPPGALLNLAGVAGTAAGTAIIGVEWHEVQITLG